MADRADRDERDDGERNARELARVTQAFLTMKKFDIAELLAAFDEGSRVEVTR